MPPPLCPHTNGGIWEAGVTAMRASPNMRRHASSDSRDEYGAAGAFVCDDSDSDGGGGGAGARGSVGVPANPPPLPPPPPCGALAATDAAGRRHTCSHLVHNPDCSTKCLGIEHPGVVHLRSSLGENAPGPYIGNASYGAAPDFL